MCELSIGWTGVEALSKIVGGRDVKKTVNRRAKSSGRHQVTSDYFLIVPSLYFLSHTRSLSTVEKGDYIFLWWSSLYVQQLVVWGVITSDNILIFIKHNSTILICGLNLKLFKIQFSNRIMNDRKDF